MNSAVAVTSRSFSKHPILRKEVLKRYPKSKFNDEGQLLSGDTLVEFLEGHEKAITALEKTLLNDADDTMVRHECAEALGAIGSSQSIPALEKIGKNDTSIEVGQTCRLALDFIQWKLNGGIEGGDNTPIACACMLSPYSSVDPAPPHPKHEPLSTIEIGAILNDESAPLFERFRAMFSLRNRGGAECVKELGNALGKSFMLLRY